MKVDCEGVFNKNVYDDDLVYRWQDMNPLKKKKNQIRECKQE